MAKSKMAGTILTYLKEYGNKSFRELPLNDVDALIFCQFAYLKFDGLVPDVNFNVPPISMRELAAHPAREGLFADERYEKVNRELFEGMVRGERFGSLRLNGYVNLIEREWETQFSAITCELEDGSFFLAFRGTDESIVGWREDCNMSFLNPIPSQRCALKYCNMVMERWKGRYYLGGHSKGGNLAVYAAMNCRAAVRERIERIYNMDGPGFRPEIQKKGAYDEIRDRIKKILPHSSFIGMLFEQNTDYSVVESKSIGLFQHNPYSWIVEGDHFVKADDVYESRKFMDQTINEWLLSLSEEELRGFITTLFSILEASHAQNLIELGEDKKKSMLAMAEAMKEVNPETAQMMGKVLQRLFEIAGTRALREINEKINRTWKQLGVEKRN